MPKYDVRREFTARDAKNLGFPKKIYMLDCMRIWNLPMSYESKSHFLMTIQSALKGEQEDLLYPSDSDDESDDEFDKLEKEREQRISAIHIKLTFK